MGGHSSVDRFPCAFGWCGLELMSGRLDRVRAMVRWGVVFVLLVGWRAQEVGRQRAYLKDRIDVFHPPKLLLLVTGFILYAMIKLTIRLLVPPQLTLAGEVI
jgi:hypothetical protein